MKLAKLQIKLQAITAFAKQIVFNSCFMPNALRTLSSIYYVLLGIFWSIYPYFQTFMSFSKNTPNQQHTTLNRYLGCAYEMKDNKKNTHNNILNIVLKCFYNNVFSLLLLSFFFALFIINLQMLLFLLLVVYLYLYLFLFHLLLCRYYYFCNDMRLINFIEIFLFGI